MTDTTANATETDAVSKGPRYDDVNTPVILMIGFISAVVTVLIIALVQGMAYQWQNSYLNKIETSYNPATEQIKNQKASVAENWESAKEQVLSQYGNKK